MTIRVLKIYGTKLKFVKASYHSFTVLLALADIVFVGNNMNRIQHVKEFLDDNFRIKNLARPPKILFGP